MTKEQLEAIKRRAAALDERVEEFFGIIVRINEDVPALVGEVEKLWDYLGIEDDSESSLGPGSGAGHKIKIKDD